MHNMCIHAEYEHCCVYVAWEPAAARQGAGRRLLELPGVGAGKAWGVGGGLRRVI